MGVEFNKGFEAGLRSATRTLQATPDLLQVCKDMLEDMQTMGLDREGYHESMNAAKAIISKIESA